MGIFERYANRPHLTVLGSFLSSIVIIATLLFVQGCESIGKYGAGAGPFRTVILDAGHGGHDRGARAIRGKLEKDLALDVTQRTASLLRSRGYHVLLTREEDVFIPLGERTKIANRTHGAIFVSIHFNWARRRQPRGIETYYHTPQSKRLAANILQELIQSTHTLDRGLKYARYYVLHHNSRPATLLELGFVSNPTENKSLQSEDYRQKLAEAIARGIDAERSNREPR